jgi:hypothetical protein
LRCSRRQCRAFTHTAARRRSLWVTTTAAMSCDGCVRGWSSWSSSWPLCANGSRRCSESPATIRTALRIIGRRPVVRSVLVQTLTAADSACPCRQMVMHLFRFRVDTNSHPRHSLLAWSVYTMNKKATSSQETATHDTERIRVKVRVCVASKWRFPQNGVRGTRIDAQHVVTAQSVRAEGLLQCPPAASPAEETV